MDNEKESHQYVVGNWIASTPLSSFGVFKLDFEECIVNRLTAAGFENIEFESNKDSTSIDRVDAEIKLKLPFLDHGLSVGLVHHKTNSEYFYEFFMYTGDNILTKQQARWITRLIMEIVLGTSEVEADVLVRRLLENAVFPEGLLRVDTR